MNSIAFLLLPGKQPKKSFLTLHFFRYALIQNSACFKSLPKAAMLFYRIKNGIFYFTLAID